MSLEILRSIDSALVPERSFQLKLVFDNIRNYLICASVLAIGHWAQEFRFGESWFVQMKAANVMTFVGYFLFAVNFMQSVSISLKVGQFVCLDKVMPKESHLNNAIVLSLILGLVAILTLFVLSILVLANWLIHAGFLGGIS